MACQINKVNLQYASSASIYGLSKNFSEDAPKSPQSPYAWTKFLFDRNISSIKAQDIVIQGFRYFNVYGPCEDHKDQPSPYHAFTRQAKETGIIKLFENSDKYLRDFIHVDNVIDIHKKFFNIKQTGIWNVGTGQPTSFETIARSIADKYGARIQYIPMPDHLKQQYQEYTCADLTKLNQTLNEKNYN